jgi:Cysteine-rich CWC
MCQHETKHCGRCQAPFECKVGNILECQCYGVALTDEQKVFIGENYSDCLCRACLEAIKLEFQRSPLPGDGVDYTTPPINGSVLPVEPVSTRPAKRSA